MASRWRTGFAAAQGTDAVGAFTRANRRKGFFNPAAVARLIDDHLDGRRDNRKQLWTLFVFDLWHDGYLSRG